MLFRVHVHWTDAQRSARRDFALDVDAGDGDAAAAKAHDAIRAEHGGHTAVRGVETLRGEGGKAKAPPFLPLAALKAKAKAGEGRKAITSSRHRRKA